MDREHLGSTMIGTSRSLAQLQAQCRIAGITIPSGASREQLFDLLRDHLGSDLSLQVDPMRARDLRSEIDWSTSGPARFAGIARYFTDEWVVEPKLDGARMRMILGLTANALKSGRRSVRSFAYTDRSDNFPHLSAAIVPGLAGTILDGELLAPSARIQSHTGTWTDSLLNASVALCNANPVGAVRTQTRFGRAILWAFDALAVKGDSIEHLSYDNRREELVSVVRMLSDAHPECNVRIVPQLESSADAIVHSIDAGFEGVMIKRRDSPYQSGVRSSDWLKCKPMSTANAFVCGYNAGKSGNVGLVGSLNLAVRRSDGTDRPVASVANLTHEMRVAISACDGTLKPEFYASVIEFSAQGLTKTGRARHANLVRIRVDKVAAECREDQLDGFPIL